MSIEETVHAAIQAGFSNTSKVPGTDYTCLEVACAICGPESGFNKYAELNNPPIEISCGLWQINTLAHKQFSCEDMKNPILNASAAFTVSGGCNFNPWTGFKNGKYKDYIAVVRQEIARQLAGNPPTTGGGQTGQGGGQTFPLNDCIRQCRKKFPASLDTNHGPNDTNFQAYKKCGEDCQNKIFPFDPGSSIQTACGDCGPTNFSACVKCASALFSKGLISVGVNLLIGGIILIGVYFLFKEELDPVISKTVKAVGTAAIA